MNDEEFEKYLDSCFEELEKKQDHLTATYKMGEFDKFDFDFEKEEIHFSNNGKIEVIVNIIPIGSYNKKSETWMWAWANEAFNDALRKKSLKLKELANITGFEMFENEMAEIEEDMAWEITGMAIHFLNSEGAYRGPANETLYFYSLTNVSSVNT